MARRSRTQITQELAKKIVRKLKAKPSNQPGTSASHKFYDVFTENILVLTFSIRHGSKKYLGNDHLMGDLFVNAHTCKCLARCTYSKDKWLEHLRDIGEL